MGELRYCVLGDGILGSEIHNQSGWVSISRSKEGFDITKDCDYPKFFLDSDGNKKYDVLINCIANTKTYSDDRESHWSVNYRSVIDLCNFCEKNSIKLVHISTSYVYTNSKSNASEIDVPIHGDNWYSFTKLLGDCYVQNVERNLVIREMHKKRPFEYEYAWIDQIGNFDYVDVISSLIIKAVENNLNGVINIGTEIKSILDLAKISNLSVKPSIADPKFPKDVSMSIDKMKQLIGKLI